jgi:transposase, IS5 family
MDSFDSYMLQKLYKETARPHDKLAETEKLIDGIAFRPIIQPTYSNKTPRGGRPNMDSVLMVKPLILQAGYGLSDPGLERQASLRIDFMYVLGYSEKAPDYSTVWRFRERLAETGTDKKVWIELQRQLDLKGLSVRRV